MLEEIRKLLKHTTIYGVGNILGKLVGFVMIPFYTHYLNPADYGTLELLDLSLSLTGLVLTMWLNASIIRHYNDFEDPEERRQAVSTVFMLACFIGLVVAIIGVLLSKQLSGLILATPTLHYYVTLEAVSFFVTSVNVVCLSYLRARLLSSYVVISGLAALSLSLFLNIYFIAIRHIGVVGVLYSGLISGTLVTAVLAIYTVRQVGLVFSWSKLREVAAFGAPLILTSAAAFVVNFSDRFFLRHFSTIATVGVYALGYKFGFMLSLLVVQPFDMIWQARLYEIGKQDKSGRMFSRLFEYYCFVLVAAALGLSIGIKELLTIISPRDFHAAYKVVPIVALAYVFQGTNRFFLAGTYIAKTTVFLAIVGVACAAANIGLNMLLIPRYGMVGAAWSTVCSFFMMSAMAWYVSQRAYRIPYVFSRVVTLIGLATLLYLVSGLFQLPSLILQVLLKLAVFAALPIVLYFLGFFSEHEVEQGKALAHQVLSRYGLIGAAAPGR